MGPSAQTSGAAFASPDSCTPSSTKRVPQNCLQSGPLWFDGPEDREYYHSKLQSHDFRGYGSIDQDTVQPEYRIPENSIKFVLQSLGSTFLNGFPVAQTSRGLEAYVGFDDAESRQVTERKEGLTLGEAIQSLYMVRLRQDNKWLPMTMAYEGGWRVDDVPADEGSILAGNLWLGDVVDSVNFELLKYNDITALVSIHPQGFRSKGQEKHGKNGEIVATSPIRWRLQLELTDSKDSDMEARFESVYDFIRGHITGGRNVLVHCIAGLSRSVAVVRDFHQRMMLERGILFLDRGSGTPDEKYKRLSESRESYFKLLQKARPGITEGNFKDQLDNSTRALCGLPPNPKSSPIASTDHKPTDSEAGGKLGEAVAMVFFFYRLRPSAHVIKIFENTRRKHERRRVELGNVREVFSFPRTVIEWFEECKDEIGRGEVQRLLARALVV